MKKAGVLVLSLFVAACDLNLEHKDKTGKTDIGRYVIINQTGGNPSVMLDTATGKTWELRKHVYLEGDPWIWNSMPRYGDEELSNYFDVLKYYKKKGEEKPKATQQ